MVNMAGQQQQYASRYPSLLVTLKHKPEDRLTVDTYTNPRARRAKDNYPPLAFQSNNVHFNGNQRYQPQPHFTRRPHTSPRHQKTPFFTNCDRLHQQQPQPPIRPLMEIKDTLFPLHNDIDPDVEVDDIDKTCRVVPQKDPKQRGQYRNRKAELDWDHAFDLDLIDLYTTEIDTDSHSLTSTISSTDTSFSSM